MPEFFRTLRVITSVCCQSSGSSTNFWPSFDGSCVEKRIRYFSIPKSLKYFRYISLTEFNAVNEMYLKYFKLFGIEKYLMRFSTHDPSKLGQKFVDEPELWQQTEVMTRNVLKNSGINYVEVPNEAAFYGPKIDVQAWSVIGREFSIATNQVDFAQPRRFNLVYKDRDNTVKTPLCIHRAPLGTHERFIGFLIEHYAGNFPLWLSPEQVRILTITDEPKLMDYARSILNELRAHEVRAEIVRM